MNQEVQYMPGAIVRSCLGLTLVDGCFLNYRNEVERKAVAIQKGENSCELRFIATVFAFKILHSGRSHTNF